MKSNKTKKKRLTVNFLQNCELRDILDKQNMMQRVASVGVGEKIWVVTSMLRRFSKTMNDNLIVTKNDLPEGVIGAREVLQRFRLEPTHDLFFKHTVDEIVQKDLPYYVFDGTVKLNEMLKRWKIMRRGFAVVKIENEYIPMSVRTLLGIGSQLDDRIKTSELDLNDIMFIDKKNTIDESLNMMLSNHIRRVVLKNSHSIVTDRSIIEKIIALDYLKNSKNFLNMMISTVKVDACPVFSEDVSVSKTCKLMNAMVLPCVIIKNKIFTPWDIIKLIL